MWGHMLLDWTTPELWQRKYLYRCAAMAQQRVPELFEISMLAEELAENELADECYRSLLRRRPSLNKTIAMVLKEKRSDQAIDPSVFSNHLETLEELANVHFPANKFPQTNAFLWNRIGEITQGIPRSDPRRAAWFAKIARSRGDVEQEIDQLEASLRIDPKSDLQWKRYVEVMSNWVSKRRHWSSSRNQNLWVVLDPNLPECEKNSQKTTRDDFEDRTDSSCSFLYVRLFAGEVAFRCRIEPSTRMIPYQERPLKSEGPVWSSQIRTKNGVTGKTVSLYRYRLVN